MVSTLPRSLHDLSLRKGAPAEGATEPNQDTPPRRRGGHQRPDGRAATSGSGRRRDPRQPPLTLSSVNTGLDPDVWRIVAAALEHR